jgi:hypothetical protein
VRPAARASGTPRRAGAARRWAWLLALLVAGNSAWFLLRDGGSGPGPRRLPRGAVPAGAFREYLPLERAPLAAEPLPEPAALRHEVTVVDAAGAPIAGAGVRGWPRVARRDEPDPSTVVEATAGADGRAVLEFPRSTLIALRASAPGFVEGRIHAAGASSRVVLEPACSLHGRVVEEAGGEGVAGARVVAWRHHPRTPGVDAVALAPRGALPPAETETGPDGAFALEGLAPGAWLLMVVPPRLAPAKRTVAVSAGTPAWVEVKVGAGFALRVRVLRAADRAPPREGRAWLEVPGWSDYFPWPARALREGVLDAEGRVVFEGLSQPEGRVHLRTEAGEHRARWIRGVPDPVTGRRDGEVLLLVAGDEVRDERVAGRVVDADGNPVAGARIVWALAGEHIEAQARNTTGFSEHLETRTDAEGRFELRSVLPSQVTWCGAPRIFVLHADFVPIEYPLPPGEARGSLEVVLGRGAALRIRVRDAAGRPVPGLVVFLRPPATDGQPLPGDLHIGILPAPVTDAAGVAAIAHVGKGRWEVEARAIDGNTGAFGAVDVAATGDVAIDLAVEPLHALHGRVLDNDGAPASREARVFLQEGSRHRTVGVDDAGRFRFEGVRIRDPGAVPRVSAYAPGRGGGPSVEFLAPPLGPVDLRLP